jgi:guanylate kinase
MKLEDGRSRRGIVFIVSAPSGAGKTTISRAAIEKIPGLAMSVSLTTRPPRGGEAEGVDYFFVDEEEFNRRRDRNELAEWARVFEASYGTPRAPLESAIAEGRDILLDIDIQGAEQIRRKYPADTVSVFVLPPSFEELRERLHRRGTESEEAIGRRLQRASLEAEAYPTYDYLIINEEREQSIAMLAAIVAAERLRVSRLRKGFEPWER